MTDVNEGTTSYHTYSLLDEDGAAVSAVEALEYKITNNLGVELLAWTAIAAPSATGEITVSATVNTKSSENDFKRYITLRATYNSGMKITNEFDYVIADLKGI